MNDIPAVLLVSFTTTVGDLLLGVAVNLVAALVDEAGESCTSSATGSCTGEAAGLTLVNVVVLLLALLLLLLAVVVGELARGLLDEIHDEM
jgi:hypothetical protein